MFQKQEFIELPSARHSENIYKLHRKTLAVEFYFSNVTGLPCKFMAKKKYCLRKSHGKTSFL